MTAKNESRIARRQLEHGAISKVMNSKASLGFAGQVGQDGAERHGMSRRFTVVRICQLWNADGRARWERC